MQPGSSRLGFVSETVDIIVSPMGRAQGGGWGDVIIRVHKRWLTTTAKYQRDCNGMEMLLGRPQEVFSNIWVRWEAGV